MADDHFVHRLARQHWLINWMMAGQSYAGGASLVAFQGLYYRPLRQFRPAIRPNYLPLPSP